MASKHTLMLVTHAALVSAAQVQARQYVTRWNASVHDAQGNPIQGSYKAWYNASTGAHVAWLPTDPANNVTQAFAFALDVSAVPGAHTVVLTARRVRGSGAKTQRVEIPVRALKPAGVSPQAQAPKPARPSAPVPTTQGRLRDPATGRLLPGKAPVPAQAPLPVAANSASPSLQDLAQVLAGLSAQDADTLTSLIAQARSAK